MFLNITNWELWIFVSIMYSILFSWVWYMSNLKDIGDEIPHHEVEWLCGAGYGLMAFVIT